LVGYKKVSRNALLFEDTTSLNAPSERVFSFFSKAENLQRLTPEWVYFRILTPLPIQMREGTLIDYRLKLHGIPVKWRTKITEWNPPYSFTDEQIKGPYRNWIHRHTFVSEGNNTLMTDHIEYRVLGGVWVDKLLVRKDIEKIFNYRKRVMESIFQRS